ncbi:VOC family protein [Variovorax sp. J22G21]|uniref:VOC family protein n=1 Tax=Variovorax fucosicus TaxID=3053517 RepID=UPI002579145F|nr:MULTISPECIES: VOC family protein [unclassified Variovorax]MDM0040174.1 VOC family protein [Variovorax sp. J22R193]MDM0061547.1 VOC family protein [Variovorax sp. J22G21]
MQVQSYLFFDGRCEEALEFYRSALGAKVTMLMRYKESPDPVPPGMCAPNSDEKVMHSEFTIGDTKLMASDGYAGGKPEFKGFSLSLDAKDDADAKRLFDTLAEGGTVQMPLGKTFFASSFGMVADRFGMAWMVIVPAPEG